MLSFPSQNVKFFPRLAGCTRKKQTRVTVNQHIFKSGLTFKFFNPFMTEAVII